MDVFLVECEGNIFLVNLAANPRPLLTVVETMEAFYTLGSKIPCLTGTISLSQLQAIQTGTDTATEGMVPQH